MVTGCCGSPACSSRPQRLLRQRAAAFLLPAYAAAFFGAAGVGRRGFSVPSTLFGALYLSVLANGLTVLNEPLWVTLRRAGRRPVRRGADGAVGSST